MSKKCFLERSAAQAQTSTSKALRIKQKEVNLIFKIAPKCEKNVQKVNDELTSLSSRNATMPDIPRFRQVDDANNAVITLNIELWGFEADAYISNCWCWWFGGLLLLLLQKLLWLWLVNIYCRSLPHIININFNINIPTSISKHIFQKFAPHFAKPASNAWISWTATILSYK